MIVYCWNDHEKEVLQKLKENNEAYNVLHVYDTIDDKSTIQLAEILKTNTTLKVLYINGGEIGDIGANAFAKALEINNTLKVLWVIGDVITDSSKKVFEDALKKNLTLTKLRVTTIVDCIYCVYWRCIINIVRSVEELIKLQEINGAEILYIIFDGFLCNI